MQCETQTGWMLLVHIIHYWFSSSFNTRIWWILYIYIYCIYSYNSQPVLLSKGSKSQNALWNAITSGLGVKDMVKGQRSIADDPRSLEEILAEEFPSVDSPDATEKAAIRSISLSLSLSRSLPAFCTQLYWPISDGWIVNLCPLMHVTCVCHWPLVVFHCFLSGCI